jgi:acyl transferase domain-containing protein/NADP-dependent 3-hydroxy acid dehydrogenase YdfG
MGCLFPRAGSLTEFWRLLRRGEDGIGEVPASHWSASDYYDPDPKSPDMTYCTRGGFLSPVKFDPTEFGIPPSILEATDTTQLLSLVAAKAALEDAGYGEDREFDRDRVSVMLGITGTQELVIPLAARLGHPLWRRALKAAGVAEDIAEDVVRRISDGYVPWQENSFPGLLGNVVAGRIANRLNLRGTNCAVDAACASSLSAVHLAMMELQSGRCDMALAGGADTLNDIFMFMCFSKTPALSPTGDARPFAADSDGTVLGEGVGILTLKRLDDAERDGDRIYAVIRAMGTSSDGKSQSIYAPHSAGQARALRNAYASAGVEPKAVGLIEAHGTGTKVGDAVEIEALRTVFRESSDEGAWCALGSVKSQIGHTKAAAGAAGLIKAALALYYKSLPPTIKVREPNPKMELERSPFYLSTQLRPWVTGANRPRRAGVSSFGFGGSNFHAVLEEHRAASDVPSWDGSVQVVAMSADDSAGLLGELSRFESVVTSADMDGERFAFIAQESRRAFKSQHKHRLVLVMNGLEECRSIAERARRCVADPSLRENGIYYGVGAVPGKLAVLFPGQGSQYVGMLRELTCLFPAALDCLAEADARVEAGQSSISECVYPAPSFSPDAQASEKARLVRTENAQPALGAVSLSAWKTLRQFGVTPEMFGGHSYGELVALCAAGRFSEAALHDLSKLRGRLMAGDGGDRGTMLAVKGPIDEVARLIESKRISVVVANRNSPTQCVLSGGREAIAQAAEACREMGFATAALSVSGAFHSSMMESATSPLRQVLEAVVFEVAGPSVYANTTGRPYPANGDAARDLLAQQLLRPVDFVGQMRAMYDDGARVFVELGPKAVLTSLVSAILSDKSHVALALDPSSGRIAGIADFANLLARLAALGFAVDLSRWERPIRETRKPKMVVPLTGANYRAPTAASNRAPLAGVEAKIAPRAVENRVVKSQAEMSRSELPKPQSSSASEALRIVQEGIRAMQSLQQQTAAAHQKFLEGQEQAHAMMRQMIEQQQRLMTGSQGFVAPAPRPSPPKIAPPVVEPVRETRPVVRQEVLPVVAKVEPRTIQAAPVPEQPVVQHNHSETLLEVVCEKTGYPREMVNLDMDIEADLGIDSIKRVEIIAAMEERLPNLTRVRPEQMGGLRTLREIVEALGAGGGESPAPVRSMPVVAVATPVIAEQVAPEIPASAAPSMDAGPVLLEVVAQLTGYPPEMLNLDMDLEADLGIDSIKRVEIVAALESRLPTPPAVKPDQMGALRTLRQIVELCAGPAPAQKAAPIADPVRAVQAPKVTDESRESRDHVALERSVLRIKALPPVQEGCITLASGREVWVVDDGAGLSAAIVSRLLAGGVSACMVPPDAKLNDQSARRVSGLVFVAPPGRAIENAWPVSSEQGAKNALVFAQALSRDLLDAVKGGAIFVTVSRMDGALGLSGADFDPVQGSLAGLVKTATKEWPGVRCKALDVAATWSDLDAAADAIVREISADGPIEVGIDSRGRRTVELVETDAPSGEISIEEGDVVLVTGGARGVTARAALGLARTCRPTLVIIGRSALPSDEPAWLTGANDGAAMKQAIMRNEFAARVATPVELNAAYERHVAAREVREQLGLMRAAGAAVHYMPVDVRDGADVRAAIADVTGRLGPVRGIVHAAGVLEDKLIKDKTARQIANVFDTKVAGLRHLLEAVDASQLRVVALFSSVSARFGNTGQADYAMANEAMNKVAQRLARRLPDCRVVSINWGPWEGGMVTQAIARKFAALGVGLIPLELGAAAFLRELRGGLHGEAEVVLGSSLPDGAEGESREAADVREAGGELAVAFETRLDPVSNEILTAHQLAGRSVLPVAMMLEYFAHAGVHAQPGMNFVGVDDLRVLRGVVFDQGARSVRLAVGAAVPGQSPVNVASELRSSGADGQLKLHATAQVLLGRCPIGSQVSAPTPLPAWNRTVESAYRDILFHGELLAGIEEVIGCGESGISARVRTADRPRAYLGEPLRSSWLTDPLVVDCFFQLAILWCYERDGQVCLPSRVGSYRQYSVFPRGRVTVQLIKRQAAAHKLVADGVVSEEGGRLVAEFRNCEFTVDASLWAAFRSPPAVAAGS